MTSSLRSALAVSAAIVAVGVTAPAATAAPKPPPGCVFDPAVGTTTCTTTVTTSSTSQTVTGLRPTGDGTPASDFCTAVAPGARYYNSTASQDGVTRPTVTEATTTTTTTVYQGASTGKGNKPQSTTTSNATTYTISGGTSVNCLIYMQPSPYFYSPYSITIPS